MPNSALESFPLRVSLVSTHVFQPFILGKSWRRSLGPFCSDPWGFSFLVWSTRGRPRRVPCLETALQGQTHFIHHHHLATGSLLPLLSPKAAYVPSPGTSGSPNKCAGHLVSAWRGKLMQHLVVTEAAFWGAHASLSIACLGWWWWRHFCYLLQHTLKAFPRWASFGANFSPTYIFLSWWEEEILDSKCLNP